MKLLNHPTILRRALGLVALVILTLSATTTIPASAEVKPAVQPVHASQIITDPVLTINPLSVRARKTLSASLVKVTFQSDGLYVAARFVANDLRDYTIRMSLFLGWGDGTWMEAAPDTPADYVSSDGYLTQQYTATAPYKNTEWSYVEYLIPWSYFPRVNQNTTVFLVAYVGLDGQPYVTSSNRQYFVLYPPSE
jgi:hypothetical protein